MTADTPRQREYRFAQRRTSRQQGTEDIYVQLVYRAATKYRNCNANVRKESDQERQCLLEVYSQN